MGIPEDKIIESQQYPHIQAEKLLIPYVHYQGANWVGNFLRREFLPKSLSKYLNLSNNSTHQRIYISRKYAQYRRIINETELVSYLGANFGFQSVTLETLPLAEQVAVLSAAKVVIAPHGAGLPNLVFCAPVTKIIEIFSPHYINRCYWLLSQQVSLDYYYLLAENHLADGWENYPKNQPGSPTQDPDMLVSLDKLAKLLEVAEVEPIYNVFS
ncbi:MULTISPECIES: glycosyltransferase family 61 protein [Planktothricoides]|uniref:Glycosyltransferase family 61 protein n=2 Tax=Planktothricoides raciborskii TaxID=132608 RepID=A0AAU8J9X7_9CYAN|nr:MULTISPECIES: glycosyltransferase family 61 protein [Planktothricoides]MBD2547085.1 glycosyltransferase family 61 protein [Planktothricoides raciborskii FACHB-1370]MBD2585427.1 glycosyltransferase family 61 protein [Planktothricoides raciborskii FACHB-1261]